MPFNQEKLEAKKKSRFDPAKLEERRGSAFARGFMGGDESSGLSLENVAEELGRNAGPIFGAIAGSFAGPGGIAIGAGAGRAFQNTAQAAGGRDISPLAAVGEPAFEAATQFAGAKLAGPAVEMAGKAASAIGKPLASGLSGVPMDFLNRIAIRPAQTLAKRGEGALGVAVDEARAALAGVVGTASKQYDDILGSVLRGGKYEGAKFNMFSALDDTFSQVRKDFGFGNPNRIGAEAAEAAKFREIVNTARNLGDATAREIYDFQRDLNFIASQNYGKPLGAAAGKIKRALRDFLGENIPEIGRANQVYKTVRPLEELAEGFGKRNNLESLIRSTWKNPNNLQTQQLAEIGKKFPAVQKALDEMKDAMAGAAVSPVLGSAPRTGLTGAALYGAGTLNPAVLATLPLMSPRLVGNLAAGGSGAVRKIAENRATAIAGGEVGSGAASSVHNYFMRRSLLDPRAEPR